jgi:hypothetical protein
MNQVKNNLEQFSNELSEKGFSTFEELKKLNFYFKTWDSQSVEELASYDKEIFIEFLIVNAHKMSTIEEVELWGFPSERLDEFLSGIKSLKCINNTQGKYTFPKSIFLNMDLEYLSLTLTPIKTIPREIGQLKKLKTLILGNTQIQKLPEELNELNELRDLTVYTKLKSIHSTISSNVNLTNIDLGSNKLTEFPEGFYELINLETLDISGNPIETFNFQIANWPKLKRLDISRTPFGIYRGNVELLKKKFPDTEIIAGAGNLFVEDNKSEIYLNCTKTTYK